jgi:branched-chain amino acid transport system permease protein
MGIAQAALDGLVYSGLYVMLGLGFFLTFSVIRRLDLSYGTVIMASVYLAAIFATRLDAPGVTLPLACLIAVGGGVTVGFVCFRLVRSDPRYSMAATLGVWMALEELVIQSEGHGRGQPIASALPDFVVGGQTAVRADHLLVLVCAIVVSGLLQHYLTSTKSGLAIRMVAFDPQAAALMGISRRRTEVLAAGLAALIGAFAGYLFGSTQQAIDVHFGMWATIKGLVILFAGGASTVAGVFCAALLLGVGERVLTELAGPSLRELVGMTILCVVVALTMGRRTMGGRL